MWVVILFTAIACLYSWPILFLVDGWLLPKFFSQNNIAAARLIEFLGHMLAMAGPTFAGVLTHSISHKGTLPSWRWSSYNFYIWGSLGMLALWALPGLFGLVFGKTFTLRTPVETYIWLLLGIILTIGWLAGMGEEFGWIGYLVPYLAPRIGKSRALLVSGVIRGIWHLPILVTPLFLQMTAGERGICSFLLLLLVSVIQLIVSNAFFSSFFGWVWYKTESLPLLGWLHQWFNAARDVTKLFVTGYGNSLWAKRLWGIPFYLIASQLLLQIARKEGATLPTFAPSARSINRSN